MSDADRFAKELRTAAARDMVDAFESSITLSAQAIESRAKQTVHRRKNARLARSITTTTRRNRSRIETETGPTRFYGAIVELGTSRSRGYPYLFPAFETEKPILEAKLDKVLTGLVKDLSR